MTGEQQERTIRLVLFVSSSAHSSAELTALIGLLPDESWERGSPFPLGRRTKLRDTSSWAVVERAAGDEHCSTVADRLAARLQGLIPRFQALPGGVDVTLRILVDEGNTVFGLGLGRPHVKFAAAIGADIDVSVAVCMSIEDLERDLAIARQVVAERANTPKRE